MQKQYERRVEKKKEAKMSNLMPTDIMDAVRTVLEGTNYDPMRGRSYMTAYQILEKLPSHTRNQLIKERGTPGQGSGKYYAAASVVSDAAEMLSEVEMAFLDSSSLRIMLKDGTDVVAPGNANV